MLLGSLYILRCLWPLLPCLIFAGNATLANGTACFEKCAVVVYDTDFTSIIDIYFYENFTPNQK